LKIDTPAMPTRKFLCCSAFKWRITLGLITRVTELIVFALFFHDETAQHTGSIDHAYLFALSYLGLALMLLAYVIKFSVEMLAPRPTKLITVALQAVMWVVVCAASLSITAFFALAIINSRTQRRIANENEFEITGLYLKLWAFIVLASSRWARLPMLGLTTRSAFVYEEVYLDDDEIEFFADENATEGTNHSHHSQDGRSLLDIGAGATEDDDFFAER
jgi:hypothetical protein